MVVWQPRVGVVERAAERAAAHAAHARRRRQLRAARVALLHIII